MESITYTTTHYNDNNEVVSEYQSKVLNYSSAGLLMDETVFNEKGKAVFKKTVRYNDNKRLHEQTEYDQNNGVLGRVTFDEDENGKLKRMVLVQDGLHTIIKTIKQLDLGNSTEVLLHTEEGKYVGKELHQFNENNDQVLESIMDEEGKEFERIEWKYSEQGKLLSEEKHYDKMWELSEYNDLQQEVRWTVKRDGEMGAIEEMEYNKSGTLTKKIHRAVMDNYVAIETYDQDIRGNTVLNETVVDGVLMLHSERKYDEHDRVIEQRSVKEPFNGAPGVNTKESLIYSCAKPTVPLLAPVRSILDRKE